MKRMLIVAMDEQGVIGKDGALPWHLPADLKRFKRITIGPESSLNAIIMGRKTFESIGRPLPFRLNIVLSRDPRFTAMGCLVCSLVEEAFRVAEERGCAMAFVTGGTSVYKEVLQRRLVDELLVTRVHHAFEGDTFFPEFDESEWVLYGVEEHQADDENTHLLTYEYYRRA